MDKQIVVDNFMKSIDVLQERVRIIDENAKLLRQSAEGLRQQLKQQGLTMKQADELLSKMISEDSNNFIEAIQQCEKAKSELKVYLESNDR